VENNFGELPQGSFVQRVYQLKGVFALSPDLLFFSYIQYDSDSLDLGMSNRMRWTIKPGKEFFILWNRNWRRSIGMIESGFLPVSDQILVKIRWTFRL